MRSEKYNQQKGSLACGILSFPLLCVFVCFTGCAKLVKVPEPINTVTASETFGTDDNATAALMAIYSDMSFHSNGLAFANGGTTIYGGLSADELRDFAGASDQFLSNTLISANTTPYGIFWQPAYFDIYMSNAAIIDLQASTGVTPGSRRQLTGEAKFIRALCYFYLTNYFGDVPLVLSNDFHQTAALKRAPQLEVFRQIIADLQDAQAQLADDYSLSSGEHIRANKWAATALLARLYLYDKNWVGADSAASAVINSGNFSLLRNLDSVFLKNSDESILQLQTSNLAGSYITFEARYFIPPSATTTNGYILSSQIIQAFEQGDQRRTAWVDSSIYNGVVYYYPHKYKASLAQSNPNNITEYYTVLRYAEQYLIRAEARAEETPANLPGAIADLNTIRARAGLGELPMSLNTTQLLSAVEQERRIELFAEWGHRWLDLKRWGAAVATLDTIPIKRGNINTDQLLYPIDLSELQTDPNLTQNAGY